MPKTENMETISIIKPEVSPSAILGGRIDIGNGIVLVNDIESARSLAEMISCADEIGAVVAGHPSRSVAEARLGFPENSDENIYWFRTGETYGFFNIPKK